MGSIKGRTKFYGPKNSGKLNSSNKMKFNVFLFLKELSNGLRVLGIFCHMYFTIKLQRFLLAMQQLRNKVSRGNSS